ncbi:Uroporphyrinogen-III decarboxylase [uncultured Roseburia sp.]|uniref:Uroporphyrinogen decarboxylase (URO-D) domain-containing protein n=1 Tax=Brotonthovivens ammoniilytica TaxID=2981725 RepID=A0ABT2TKG9_9FIRM|nr:uroporphyrinogen decarboxylase family protein [Brotonthovivens ammoniilytica]MCU6762709.1 hypothetical protein [Brotonthovivens ammoniilytica]SCI85613.1 Uroporphyrinogen-III decarboxylase [uncultured Roseburia sp.]
MGTNEALHPDYSRRLKLFEDSITCQRVDHVMAAPYITYLPITLYGETTIKDTIADWRNALPSFLRYHKEYQPDFAYGPKSIFCGPAMEALDCQFVRWPGKHFDDDNIGFQIPDKEYMAQEEYLEYAEDPTGFLMKKILPRHYGKYKGLGMLDFSNAVWHGGMYATLPAVNPEVKESFNAIIDCAGKLSEQVGAVGDYFNTLAGMGIPSGSDYMTSAPFDIFNDTLRGFLNVSMDIYECPDELLAAVNAASKVQVRGLKNMMKSRPMRVIGFMLHNGFDSFMSRENFETFYWPGLKDCIDACIEYNVTPWIYVEDSYMSKLDIIERDVPAHKCMMTFTGTNDMKKIKERFGGKYCLRGGLEGTMLEYASPDDVVKAVKEAIDIYAPGGGYILDFDVNIDNAKPENLQAFFDTARNYMKY